MASSEVFEDGLPIIAFDSPADWRAYLDRNPDAAGVWIKIAKKGSGVTTATYAEALEEALCYGWIDGLVHRYDEQYYIQRFTPRRPRSIWSQVNVAKVTALIEQGKVTPAGQAAIDLAKANGQWDAAYAAPSTSTEASDFLAALDTSPIAKAFYDTLNKTNKYAINWRIGQLKKPESRATKIAAIITMLESGEKFH